jgi:anti-sigma B factor antagonist
MPTGAPEILTVRSRVAGRRAIVSVAGEIDLATVPVLRSAIADALESSTDELWIDLGETEFIDSAGLHLLIGADHETCGLGRRLAIFCPSGPVRRVFDIAGLAEVLPLRDHLPSHV